MATTVNPFLLVAAVLNALAALLHLGCIVFGAPWYRYMGAGEPMASMAERGHWVPTVVTLGVAAVLMAWSLVALSGAGVLPRLPLLRWALAAIAGIYLLRAVAFPWLMPQFPGNSATFWAVSSGICFVLGMAHLIGLRQVWERL